MTIGTVCDTKIDLSLVYKIGAITTAPLIGYQTIDTFQVGFVGASGLHFQGDLPYLTEQRDSLIAQWEAYKNNQMFERLYPTQARAQATMAKLKGEPVDYGA
jgi:hypothetical protein